MIIVVVSGAIASGKSKLAMGLVDSHGFLRIQTRAHLIQLLGQGPNPPRGELQALGARLSQENPAWIAHLIRASESQQVVVDACREAGQIEQIRENFPRARILHVHLTAQSDDLRARFEARGETNYYEVRAESVEQNVSSLADEADLVINTTPCTPEDVLIRVVAKLPFHSGGSRTLVDVLVGGQYGSEGKGHVVSYLAPEYNTMVRVGGPNAGHTVLFKGEKVSFYHLPSGVLHNAGAKIFFGAGMNIRLPVLAKEMAIAEKLGINVKNRLYIDKNANIITDADVESEGGLVGGIGSTGQGVGAATARRILNRKPDNLDLAMDSRDIWDYGVVCDIAEELDKCYDRGERVLLEGTQGTGLSLFHGPYPYVTSRDTTASGTLADAGISPLRVRKVVMVVRTNPIRVQSPNGGTSGPMSKEIPWEEVAKRAGVDAVELKEREKTTTTKRQRRVSEFDWGLLKRSAGLNAPTDLALTFVDYISESNQDARRFEQLTGATRAFIEEVETVARSPVTLITTRFHSRSIIDRRAW